MRLVESPTHGCPGMAWPPGACWAVAKSGLAANQNENTAATTSAVAPCLHRTPVIRNCVMPMLYTTQEIGACCRAYPAPHGGATPTREADVMFGLARPQAVGPARPPRLNARRREAPKLSLLVWLGPG